MLRRAGSSYGGSFKKGQNYINETRLDGTTFMRFTPFSPYETREAMDRLCETYEQVLAKGHDIISFFVAAVDECLQLIR